jgi:hypothetical protein
LWEIYTSYQFLSASTFTDAGGFDYARIACGQTKNSRRLT